MMFVFGVVYRWDSCYSLLRFYTIFFVKQKTAYELRIRDWSSDVCSSDLLTGQMLQNPYPPQFVLFAKGTDAEKLIITGLADVSYDTQIGRASCRERVCQYG